MSVFTSIGARDVLENLPLINTDEAKNDNGVYHNKFSKLLFHNLHPELNTYNELFNNAVSLYGNARCLAYRDYSAVFQSTYTTFSYNQVQRLRTKLGSGILYVLYKNQFKFSETHDKIDEHLESWSGFNANTYSFILTIFSGNRYEWILTDLACVGYSITNTALYDTLDENSTESILAATKSPIVVCSADKISRLKALKRSGNIPELICIVSMDNYIRLHKDPDLRLEVWNFKDILEFGRKHALNHMPPTVDSIYTISYTSGTTSDPKGVVLKHEQAVAGVSFLMTTSRRIYKGKSLVFLPLACIYERQASAFALCSGYLLGFPRSKQSRNDLKNLVEDLKVYNPHYVSLEPHILNRLLWEIKGYIDSVNDFKLTQIIHQKALTQKQFNGNRARLVDDLYAPYVKLKKKFGFSNVDWINTTSAPASSATIEFLRASLNIGIKQLYGATETFGALSSTLDFDTSSNSSGIISICSQFKLAANNELLVKGSTVFTRYFNNPEETSRVLQDGWYHTGDIADIGSQGEITIVGRAEDFFTTSQGAYISAERLENTYMSSNPNIASIFVTGNPTGSYIVGIVSVSDATSIPQTRGERLEFLNAINANVKSISKYEKLQNIYVGSDLLSDVLTPTYKLKRKEAFARFKNIIDKMYQEGSLYSSKI